MIVSRRIYDLGLPHRAVTVYCYLCDRSNINGECFPSTRRIAEDLSITRRTVFRALKDLESAKLITRKKRYRIHGGYSSNNYDISDISVKKGSVEIV